MKLSMSVLPHFWILRLMYLNGFGLLCNELLCPCLQLCFQCFDIGFNTSLQIDIVYIANVKTFSTVNALKKPSNRFFRASGCSICDKKPTGNDARKVLSNGMQFHWKPVDTIRQKLSSDEHFLCNSIGHLQEFCDSACLTKKFSNVKHRWNCFRCAR